MITPRQLASRLRKALRYRRALRHRHRSGHALFVGVTGTSGKTTTTRLAAAILRAAGPCTQTDANNALNDLIRTVRATGPAERYCVAELAAAGPGSLDRKVALFRPDIAVLTMIGREHFTAYRSIDAIAAEKEKIVLAPPAEGIAVLNLDDPLVAAIAARTRRRVIGFGRDPAATLRLVAARSRWPEPLVLEVEHAGRRYAVATQLHGEHLAVPVLAARKVAIVGTVSDTRGDSGRNYRQFARTAREAADLVVFVGPLAHRALRARATPGDATIQAFPTVREAAAWLRDALRAGDLVLLKGSNRADHLLRIALDRDAAVGCWQERCDRITFCNHCPALQAGQPVKVMSRTAPRAAAAR